MRKILRNIGLGMELFNRLNVLILLFLSAVIIGCNKRDRLTASTFSFRVSPSAAAITPGQTVTLTAQANGGAGANATWMVSASSVGTVVPEVGSQVVFTATGLGDVVVSAVVDGQVSQTQIGVVSYIPSTSGTIFNVYTDNGLPPAPFESDIFITTMPAPIVLQEVSSGFAPEGNKYLHVETVNGTNDFVAVTLDENDTGISTSLAGFSKLKFSIRLAQIVSANALAVQFKSTNGQLRFARSGAGGAWTTDPESSFNPDSVGDWQEVVIPIGNFSANALLNIADIDIPFLIIQNNQLNGANLIFDIDAVRWEM
jgi:hypothetical protein